MIVRVAAAVAHLGDSHQWAEMSGSHVTGSHDMGDIVNLNKFRKERQRADEQRQARDNRVRFGRTGADKAADRAASEKAESDLSGKKRDTPGQTTTDDGDTPETPAPKAR